MSRTICRCVGLLCLLGWLSCSQQAGKGPAPPETAESGSATSPATAAQTASETPAQPAAAPQPTAGDPEAIVRRVAEFYQQAQSLAVDSEQAIVVTGTGIDNRMTTKRTIAAERPNKLAATTTEGMASFDFFSDGKELTISVPTMKKYTVSPAPESFDALLTNPLLAGGSMGAQSTFVLQLLPGDPYATLMQGVTAKEYVGTEEVRGVRAHHLRFVQEQFDWDLWTPVEGDPVVLQVSTDMSKTMSQLGGGGGRFKDLKMVSTETFGEWKRNAPIEAVAFTFTAPEGVEKVDSLFEGLGGEEELSPLLGQPAPPVELALLDGGSLNLASHAGESFVMLDFWATWCGPCVEEMPILLKVAEEYRDKGVVLYAVNQQEEPEEITKFLEEQKLTATVALDTDSTAGDDYGVQGIPMLVLIDKQGVVQSVHVGFSPNLEQELRKELDDLIAGKNISEEKLAKAKAKEQESEIKAEGLQEAWSVRGRFTGVAADQATGTIYAITRRGEVKSFDVNGKELASFESPQSANALRSARLLPGTRGQLLGFGSWGDTVVAMNFDGTELWNEIGGTGIDDVWAADLDGDGQDEVLVGYNGDTGLHVFNADGSRRWKSTDIGNVWHVSAGDVSGDEAVEVISTSAEGQVHVFNADGEERRDIRVPLYANMVRVGKASGDRPKAAIFLSGSSMESETVQMVAIDGEGTVLWQRELPADVSHCDSLDLDRSGQWVAAGLRGGQIVVLNPETGEVVAQAPGFGEQIEVAWIAPTEGAAPLLLVADGRNLKAFGIVPKGE